MQLYPFNGNCMEVNVLTHSISCVLQACVGYMNVHNDTSVLEHMFMTVCVFDLHVQRANCSFFFFLAN